jgi:hypothetical protein
MIVSWLADRVSTPERRPGVLMVAAGVRPVGSCAATPRFVCPICGATFNNWAWYSFHYFKHGVGKPPGK